MAFSHFFSRVWVDGRKPGLREELGIPGRTLAGACVTGSLPCPSPEEECLHWPSVWPDSRAYGVTNCVSQSKDAHTNGVTCFKGTLTEGDNTQFHLSPSQTSLAESCSALWEQVFQIYQSQNLGGSSSAFSSCVPISFWALGSSSRKWRKWQCLPPQVTIRFLWTEKCKGLHTASATNTPRQLSLLWLSRDEGLQTQQFCLASNSE